ncbi:MAG: metal ABC transporter substrate-binding protein [Anaerolineae bacterium]
MSTKANKQWSLLAVVLLLATLLTSCGTGGPATQGSGHEKAIDNLQPISLSPGQKLQVVATTNIVADVVKNVGGDRIELVTLMGIGVDPHTYVPTPSDTAAVHDADVVFANGAGLEANLDEMLASAGGNAAEIHVSDGIEFLPPPGSAGQDTSSDGTHAHEEDVDPHVWFSVPNVIHWTQNIEHTLSALDPENTGYYGQNAQAYIAKLEPLDAWIQGQVNTIPEAHRKIVTNHPVFGYFAERYGLEQLGAVYPISPSASPSAQEVAALQEAIQQYGVPAVFAETTVNPKLAQQVANDTGIKLVPLYTGSLGGPGSGAETYIEMMRYDVTAIVEALQ